MAKGDKPEFALKILKGKNIPPEYVGSAWVEKNSVCTYLSVVVNKAIPAGARFVVSRVKGAQPVAL
ncbi:MAG: hypothetical protein NTU61_06540 [Candidatus Altiarchaeota archaeon]|nr:hypothetical protein [Candidatus Altiarchaeota archaeon]